MVHVYPVCVHMLRPDVATVGALRCCSVSAGMRAVSALEQKGVLPLTSGQIDDHRSVVPPLVPVALVKRTSVGLGCLKALKRGLVNRVAPPEELDAAVAALCDAIRAKPAATVATGKRMFHRQIEKGLTEAHRYAGAVMACDMMGDDAQEGIGAFLDKRPPALGGRARRRVAGRGSRRLPPGAGTGAGDGGAHRSPGPFGRLASSARAPWGATLASERLGAECASPPARSREHRRQREGTRRGSVATVRGCGSGPSLETRKLNMSLSDFNDEADPAPSSSSQSPTFAAGEFGRHDARCTQDREHGACPLAHPRSPPPAIRVQAHRFAEAC